MVGTISTSSVIKVKGAERRDISDAMERILPVADEVTRRMGWIVERIRLLTSAATVLKERQR